MTWHTRGKELALKEPGDVIEIRMITTIHDTGVDYEVRAALRSLERGAYEEGENEVCVWVEQVTRGHSSDTTAGGPAFVRAARAQEQAARELWSASHGAKQD